ncbi:MAG TPA: hypothetical protein VKE69_11080 [Planctomycetota bacterium]|nr:hypothetical protein [Planctomycetota bacterium]
MSTRLRRAAALLLVLAALALALRVDIHRHAQTDAPEHCAVCLHASAPALVPDAPAPVEAPALVEHRAPARVDAVREQPSRLVEEIRGPPAARIT